MDEPFGFAIGWNYWVNDAVSYAGDLTAAQVLMEYWTDKLTWLPSLCFFFFLTGLNMIHVKAYGELEYWLSLLKVASIVVFFFVGIAVNVGANSEGRYSECLVKYVIQLLTECSSWRRELDFGCCSLCQWLCGLCVPLCHRLFRIWCNRVDRSNVRLNLPVRLDIRTDSNRDTEREKRRIPQGLCHA